VVSKRAGSHLRGAFTGTHTVVLSRVYSSRSSSSSLSDNDAIDNKCPDDAPRIAVIGGGIAGMTCASQLVKAGVNVDVFEAARGVGGRMATRRGVMSAHLETGRIESGGNDSKGTDHLGAWLTSSVEWDHGASYFTVTHRSAQAIVDGWVAAGLAAEWSDARGKDGPKSLVMNGKGEFSLNHTVANLAAKEQSSSRAASTKDTKTQRHFVGVPRMSSICEGLKATDWSNGQLVTHVGARATKFERSPNMGGVAGQNSSWIVH